MERTRQKVDGVLFGKSRSVARALDICTGTNASKPQAERRKSCSRNNRAECSFDIPSILTESWKWNYLVTVIYATSVVNLMLKVDG